MAAKTYNIVIDRGSTWNFNFEWLCGAPPVTVVLTGFIIRMKIRQNFATPEIISLYNGHGITVVNNIVNIRIEADVTEDIPIDHGFYDIEIDTGLNVVRLLQGKVTITNEITRCG